MLFEKLLYESDSILRNVTLCEPFLNQVLKMEVWCH